MFSAEYSVQPCLERPGRLDLSYLRSIPSDTARSYDFDCIFQGTWYKDAALDSLCYLQ